MKKLIYLLHNSIYVAAMTFVFSAILAIVSYWFIIVHIYVPHDLYPIGIEGYILWSFYELIIIRILYGKDFWS